MQEEKKSIAKDLIKEIAELTKGEIFLSFPIEGTDNKLTYLYLDITKYRETNTDEILTDKLNSYCNYIIRDSPNFYYKIRDWAFSTWDEYKKRQKMHYIYKTKIGIEDTEGKEKLFNLYDLSVLKMQIENGLIDKDVIESTPDFVKDIKRFTKLVLPLNLQTVYLVNEEERQLLDLRTEQLYKLE